MSAASLQVHVEMEEGAIARVSPEAMNDPAFVAAMNAMIRAVRLGGGGGVLVGDDNGESESRANGHNDQEQLPPKSGSTSTEGVVGG